jgi:hypothetical protein
VLHRVKLTVSRRAWFDRRQDFETFPKGRNHWIH